MHKVWLFVKRYKFSLLLLAVILFLSFFKPPHTGLDEITNFDKFVHFSMYFGFGAVIWLEYLCAHRADYAVSVFRNTRFDVDWRQLVVGAVVLPIVLSGGIELAQENLTAYRGGEWWDFASNSAGILMAALCGYFLLKGLRRRG